MTENEIKEQIHSILLPKGLDFKVYVQYHEEDSYNIGIGNGGERMLYVLRGDLPSLFSGLRALPNECPYMEVWKVLAPEMFLAIPE